MYNNTNRDQQKIYLLFFSEQVDIPDDDIIQATDYESALTELMNMEETMSGLKVMDHGLEMQIDNNIAAKFGQRTVSSNQVPYKLVCNHHYTRI